MAAVTLVDEAEARAFEHLGRQVEPGAHRVPLVGGPAQFELASNVPVNTPGLEVLPRRTGVGAIDEALVVPGNGLIHGGHELGLLLARRGRRIVLVQGDAGAVGQESHRFHEVEVHHFADPRDLVASGATTEAVVAALFGVHRERRGLFGVERTEAAPAATTLFEGHLLGNKGDNVRGGTYLRDLAL